MSVFTRTRLQPPPGATALAASYQYCRRLARRSGRNFYYSFLTLPREQLRAMCALYAFMRVSDDLGDEPGQSTEQRARSLAEWRESLTRALAGETGGHPLFPALHDIVTQYAIPAEYLFAVLDGMEMDLGDVRFETLAQLQHYCYHVAGAVGLCCIHIWGFRHPEAAIPAAVSCGLAFQLTNILRDLKEDAALGRCYLPEEDLQRFGYTREDLAAECRDERFRRLMAFETARARAHYTAARALFEHLEPRGRPILETMLRIYGGLLDEIERRDYDVFSERVSVSRWKKLYWAGRGVWLRFWPAA